jgi:eukaryotic-like serine/threonine-protein kinase
MVSLPLRGDVLVQRYRIDELIGQGGMGAVFRATQVGLLRAVAIKVLLPERTGPRVRERFEREARVAATLRHPGVVEVYDFGVDEMQRLYLVMELLLGSSLTRFIRGENSDVTFMVEACAQVADVLKAAHSVGMVHRDIKPDNIFVLDGDPLRIKVVDFGLAFIREGGELGRLTSNDVIAGTPQFMSPEQCRGQEVGSGADVYALGCVLFDVLTGDAPFRGAAGELLAQHIHVPPPKLSARRPGLPTPLVTLVDEMLHKSAAARPTAQEVAERLRALKPRATAADFDRSKRALAPSVAAHAEGPTTRAQLVTVDLVSNTELAPASSVIEVACDHLDETLRTTLIMNGIEVKALHNAPGAGLEYWPEAAAAQVAQRIQLGRTVVVAADPNDVSLVSELMRMGVAELVVTPVEPVAVAAKLVRAAGRMHKRGAHG